MTDINITVPAANPTVAIVAGNGTSVADIIGSTELGRSLLQAASVAAAIALLGGSVATLDEYLSGGGGTPGGSDTQIQFNDGGAFGGNSALTFNKTTGQINRLLTATDLAGVTYGFNPVSTLTWNTAGARNHNVIRPQVLITANSVSTGYSYGGLVNGYAWADGTGSLAGLVGFQGGAEVGGAVTLTDQVTGLSFYTGAYNTSVVSRITGINIETSLWDTSTVTNYFGIKIHAPAMGSNPTVTSAYGLWLGSHTHANIANGWNIYSDGATSRNYFAGKIGIGTATPSVPLDVVGASNISGKLTVGDTAIFVYGAPTSAAIVAANTFTPTANGGGYGANIVIKTADSRGAFSSTGVFGLAAEAYVPSTATTAWLYAKAGVFTGMSRSPISVNVVSGLEGYANHVGTGTVGELRGLQFGAAAYNDGFGAAGAVTTANVLSLFSDLDTNVTTLRTVYVQQPYGYASKTITNAYGVYIGNHSATTGSGTITNGWNIYSDGATSRNYFAGSAQIVGTFAHGSGTLFDPFGGNRSNFSSVSTAAAAAQNYQNDFGARFQITAPNAYLFERPYYYGAGTVAYIPTTRQTGGLPSAYGIYAQGINRSPYPVDQVNGFYGYAYHMGAGTCAYLGGIQFGAYAVNDWYPDGLGAPAVGNVTNMVIVDTSNWIQANVTNYYGVRLYYPDLASGKTITNCYGYYVQNHSGTGITNGWNIYSEGATSRNYFGGSVGIGTTTPTVPLDVVGRTNVTIGTPVNYYTITNSALAAKWQGNLSSGRDAALFVEMAGTETSGNTDMSGIFVSAIVASGAIDYAQGANLNLQNRSSSAVGYMYGVYGEAKHAGTGALTSLAGLQYSVGSSNLGFGAPGAVGSAYGAYISNYFESDVTTFYSVYLGGVGLDSGKTIANAYGIRIGNHSATGVTNGWNIYSVGAASRNYFEGKVGIGIAAPVAAPLEIVGNAAGVIHMTASQNVAYWKALTIYNSGMGSGNGAQIVIGQAASINNAFEFAFFYTSSGSSSNYGAFGLYNTPDTFKIFDNRVEINKTLTLASAMLQMAAATTARASLNMPAGVAPTSPANGDMWFDGTDIKMRVGGVTKTFTLT
jgi:hypothetical protein